MNPWDDHERYTTTVLSAHRDGDGYEVHTPDGTVFLAGDRGPAAGEVVTMWGQRGGGGLFRGIARQDGTVLYYVTLDEIHAKWGRLRAVREAEQVLQSERDRPDTERRIAALPPILQERVARLRQCQDAGPEWKWLRLEVLTLEDAVRIADQLRTEDAITVYQRADYERQRELVPDLSDIHSGGSFGMTCVIARVLVTDPDALVRDINTP